MVWKELGEALGDLAGTGERVNMVSAALFKGLVREGFDSLGDGCQKWENGSIGRFQGSQRARGLWLYGQTPWVSGLRTILAGVETVVRYRGIAWVLRGIGSWEVAEPDSSVESRAVQASSRRKTPLDIG